MGLYVFSLILFLATVNIFVHVLLLTGPEVRAESDFSSLPPTALSRFGHLGGDQSPSHKTGTDGHSPAMNFDTFFLCV